MAYKKIGVMLLLSLFWTLSSMGQSPLNANTPSIDLTQTISDSTKVLRTDTLSQEDNMYTVLSDRLDSLVSTWHVQSAFSLDSIQKVIAADTLAPLLPDSVYISRLQNLDSYIPLPFNESVRKFINFYLNRRRAQVSIMMGLTNFYFPLFEEVLAKYNLPQELKFLPIIESALNPKIVSRAGASGLWQFMPFTGKKYGLEITSYIDERNDPIKSTEAAARYLRDLYTIYGDWHLVIAAYNCGPGNINKAVRRSGGSQNYWDIYSRLPKETRGYIPIFIAANYVMNYAKDHNLTPILPSFKLHTDTVWVKQYVNFEQVAAVLNLPIEEIRQLNPQYKHDIIPAKADKPYALKLPMDKISPFIDSEKQILAYNRDKYFPNNQIALPRETGRLAYSTEGKKRIFHTVRSGETPGEIASKYHISVTYLKEWNGIRNNRIRVGQKLAIYVKEGASNKVMAKTETTKVTSSEPKQAPASAVPQTLTPTTVESATTNVSQYTVYEVRKGDSLHTIAKQFVGVSDMEIKLLNNIRNDKSLMPGQKLKIPIKA